MISNVLVHVYPIDLLGYIRYQCKFHLKNYFMLDDSFTDDMQNDISRMFLYTAARISTETSSNTQLSRFMNVSDFDYLMYLFITLGRQIMS